MIEILRPDHRLLRGLRFFGVANNTGDVRNLAARGGGSGTASGGPTLGRLGKLFGAVQGDATNNLITFSPFNLYFGTDARDITVICRCKSNASHVGIAAKIGASTPGWQLLFSNAGGSETGWNFAVFSAAGKFQEAQDGFGAVAQTNVDVVVAGKYVHSTRQVSIYTRQPTDPHAKVRNNRTNHNSSNPATEDWDIRGTAGDPLYWLSDPALGFPFNGDIAWMAVFDRELSNDEIAEWSIDEAWEFAEDYPVTTSFVANQYRTLIGVSGSGGFSQSGSSREYDNQVDAIVTMTGDLTNVGSGSTTRSFRTDVAAGQSFSYGIPMLRRYRTRVGETGDSRIASTRSFRTLVGATNGGNALLDGRRDLLYTGGYRR